MKNRKTKFLVGALLAMMLFVSQICVAFAMDDGTYTPSFGYEGGTGRVEISCPSVTVTDGEAMAELHFDSTHYTYVRIDDVKYDNETPGEESTFTIPVVLDGQTHIAAETTAMSEPHEVEYTLYVYTNGEDVSDIRPAKVADEQQATVTEDENSWGEFGADQQEAEAVATAETANQNKFMNPNFLVGFSIILLVAILAVVTVVRFINVRNKR